MFIRFAHNFFSNEKEKKKKERHPASAFWEAVKLFLNKNGVDF